MVRGQADFGSMVTKAPVLPLVNTGYEDIRSVATFSTICFLFRKLTKFVSAKIICYTTSRVHGR